jgi:hypothetical protein
MTVLETSHPYRDRRTWLHCVHQTGDWKLKVYAITTAGGELSADVLDAALRFVSRELQPEHLEEDPLATDLGTDEKFGFLVLHVGAEAVWLLLDLWIGDILHHHLYRAPLEEPAGFSVPWQKHSAACVWELEVIHHERNAWVEHVLKAPDQPAYEDYLASALHIDAG